MNRLACTKYNIFESGFNGIFFLDCVSKLSLDWLSCCEMPDSREERRERALDPLATRNTWSIKMAPACDMPQVGACGTDRERCRDQLVSPPCTKLLSYHLGAPSVLPTLFKSFRPDYHKNSAARKKNSALHGNLFSGRNNKLKTNKLQGI
jgi:hypothetical protein